MTIEQLLHSGDFKLSVISTQIYNGVGNKNRLNYIKNGKKNLTECDKEKICKYFIEKYEINLQV